MNRWMAFGLTAGLIFAAPAIVRAQHGNSSHGSSSTHGSSTHAAKPPHGASTHKASTDHKSSATKTTTSGTSKKDAKSSTTTTSATTLTPVQQKLQKNTKLSSKLRSRLPDGTDPVKAAKGFRNLGQFVAAVNVSHNLGIPFEQLKTKMVTDGVSLGQAIQALRPQAHAETEVEHAEHEAGDMVRETSTTTTSTHKKSVKHHDSEE